MDNIQNKTGVCGSNPQWPTMSAVLEDISLPELVIELLGADVFSCK